VIRARTILGVMASVGVLGLALPMGGTPASAGPLAVVEGQSLDIKAAKLDVDVDKGTATLEGDVSATMGELEVLCPKIEIKYDQAPRVRWARGSGGVKARVKGIEAVSNVVVVDLAKRVVNLSGRVRLTRGRGWVEADRASIDLATHKVTLHEVKGSIPVEPPAR
jgi:lipopolysaccharide export system protein LptA